REQSRDLRTAAMRMLTLHRPGRDLFIGLGQSSTPVAAFLDALGLGGGGFPLDDLDAAAERPADLARVAGELARRIPAERLADDATVVLHDAVSSPRALASIRDALGAALEAEHGRP